MARHSPGTNSNLPPLLQWLVAISAGRPRTGRSTVRASRTGSQATDCPFLPENFSFESQLGGTSTKPSTPSAIIQGRILSRTVRLIPLRKMVFQGSSSIFHHLTGARNRRLSFCVRIPERSSSETNQKTIFGEALLSQIPPDRTSLRKALLMS